MASTIYIVVAPGLVLGSYLSADHAHQHARTVTGASVVPCDLLDRLPPTVLEDITTEYEWEDEGDTPVMSVEEIDDPPG